MWRDAVAVGKSEPLKQEEVARRSGDTICIDVAKILYAPPRIHDGAAGEAIRAEARVIEDFYSVESPAIVTVMDEPVTLLWDGSGGGRALGAAK